MQGLNQEITLMEMDSDTIQELIAGYAVGALDEAETLEAEKLLETNAEARELLAEFEAVTAGLALSVEPVALPAGSLERLRQKAGVDLSPGQNPPANEPHPRLQSIEGGQAGLSQNNKASRSGRNTFWRASTFGAYAAALVLFITTAVFGLLWLNTNSRLDQAEQTRQGLAGILSAPGLKVADLKATSASTATDGNLRLYADPASNKVYLVARNLTDLPSDKEYEAWLITADNQAHPAGLLGSGVNNEAAIFTLTASVPVNQYKLVALTIEKKGGVDKPTQQPVLAGTIPV
jgi:anti-sigma-K factor RskA